MFLITLRKEYFSYQSAVTYKPNSRILFRAGISRAYRAPLFGELYFNERTTTVVTEDPPVSILTTIRGNTDIELVQADLIEAGMRLQVSERIDMNVGIFRSQFANYAEIVRQQTGLEISPTGEITGLDDILIQKTSLSAIQYGMTISSNIVTEKWQFKPFITVQHTELENYTPYLNTEETSELILGYNPIEFNINTTEDKRHEATPTLYGGFYFNYIASSKLNLNTSSYFWTQQTFYHRQNIETMDGVSGIYDIKAKYLLNLTARYRAANKINTFLSIKNILGSDSVEFARGEHVGCSFWAGVNISI